MAFTNIEYTVAGPVARILHARPQARNAENMALLDEFDAALSQAIADDAVRVIVFGGQGDHFSAGHDLKEGQVMLQDCSVEERYKFEELRYYGYALRLWDCPKPTIAQVQGACFAGAFMLANMCDLVVASDDAYFSDPVCHTLAAASVEVLIHPWVMGLRKAKEFLFMGERMSAREAHAIGMVNRIVPRAQLESETTAMAERIATAPPFAIKMLKRSLNRSVEVQGLRTALSAHFDTHELCHTTSEFDEKRRAGISSAIRHKRA